MIQNKPTEKSRSRKINGHMVSVLTGLLLVFLSVYLLRTSRHPTDESPHVQTTVARLQEMENRDVMQLQAEFDAQKAAEEAIAAAEAEAAAAIVSVDEIQARILSGDLYDNITLRQKFSGTVIIGDSITEAIVGYGYLDADVVISKLGLSVAFADDQIETAIYMNPSTVFMAFGSNDLQSFVYDADGFTDGYRRQIVKIQTALPGVPIYINCVLPITESAIAATPPLGYYPEYNTALQEMCDEMGLHFIDNSFIMLSDASLYEPDGEHPTAAYYPMWLTNMAEMAGL